MDKHDETKIMKLLEQMALDAKESRISLSKIAYEVEKLHERIDEQIAARSPSRARKQVQAGE